MLSIDTNLLVYAQNTGCDEHRRARAFLSACRERDVVICELVLVELYLVLRSAAIVSRPLAAEDAVDVCSAYRNNPRWRLVEHAPVMAEVWERARTPGFARRRIIDARLALTLRHHGVTELATANVRDFGGFGFARVWNPVEDVETQSLTTAGETDS